MATAVADVWTDASVSCNEIKILSLHLQGTRICALAYTKYSLWVTLSKEGGREGGIGTKTLSSPLIKSLLELKTIEAFGDIQPTELMHILKVWQNTHIHTERWEEIATNFFKLKWWNSSFSKKKLIKVEAAILCFKMNSNQKWIYSVMLNSLL